MMMMLMMMAMMMAMMAGAVTWFGSEHVGDLLFGSYPW